MKVRKLQYWTKKLFVNKVCIPQNYCTPKIHGSLQETKFGSLGPISEWSWLGADPVGGPGAGGRGPGAGGHGLPQTVAFSIANNRVKKRFA